MTVELLQACVLRMAEDLFVVCEAARAFMTERVNPATAHSDLYYMLGHLQFTADMVRKNTAS